MNNLYPLEEDDFHFEHLRRSGPGAGYDRGELREVLSGIGQSVLTRLDAIPAASIGLAYFSQNWNDAA